MKASQEHYTIGVALVEALEPLIDVCLDTGITSPEFEKLLRVAFVLRAFDKLPKHKNSGRGPTVNKVSVATGLAWDEVAKIQSAGGHSAAKGMMGARERTSSKAARVIEGWTTDPKFHTSGGHPVDLPIKRAGTRPTWRDLVAKYASSTHPGTLMKEMSRTGQLQIIEGEIVRFKRAKTRRGGLTPAAIADASRKVKRLGATLYQSLQDGDSSGVYDETASLKVSTEQMARMRPILERQIKTFLQALENEFRGREALDKPKKHQEFGVGVFSWKERR